MIARAQRVTSKEFAALGKPLRVFHTPFFSARAHALVGGPKYAVVVSKKVAGTAPARNKVRRRLYEIARTRLPHSPGSSSLIFFVKKEAFAASFEALASAVEGLGIS